MDQWGGDRFNRPTCKLRCVCSYRQDGRHVMISDHMWLDGPDAERIIGIAPSEGRPVVLEPFGAGARPKRGLKLFLTAKALRYAPGKAKLHAVGRAEPVAFVAPGKQEVYWAEGMPRDARSCFWHGGG